MTLKDWSLVTSLYIHDIILVLLEWIIKQDYKKKKWSLKTGATHYIQRTLWMRKVLKLENIIIIKYLNKLIASVSYVVFHICYDAAPVA